MAKRKSNTPVFKTGKTTKQAPVAKLQVQKTDVGTLTEKITSLIKQAEDSGLKPVMAKATVTLF